MKIKTLLIFFALFFLSSQGFAADRIVPYKPVKNPQPAETEGKIEVVEIFWYGCPHCYALEPRLAAWVSKLPEDVVFRRVPGVLGQNWVPLARAYYTAEELGVVDKVHRPLFDAIHKDGKNMNDIDNLKKLFANYGVDKDKFLETYQSDAVQDKLKQAYLLGVNYGITGVPTLIIDGKYMTSPSITGSIDATFDAMDMLIEKERSSSVAKE